MVFIGLTYRASISALYPATGSKFTANLHRHWLAGGHQVLKDSINGIFIKGFPDSISGDVFLQRLQLQAPPDRENIPQKWFRIGQAGLGQMAVYSGRIISISYRGIDFPSIQSDGSGASIPDFA